jgi:uncharacterized membrane protein
VVAHQTIGTCRFGPSLVSVGGTFTLLVGHRWFPHLHWLLNLGILLVFGGSLWNSFSIKRRLFAGTSQRKQA